jgi:hypothetical protein
MPRLLIILFALTLFRCTPSDSKQADSQTVEAAEQALFAVHDSVMPRMGELLKAKKLLRQRMARLDSLSGSPAETVRADDEKAEAQRLYRRLDEADSLMMGWMEHYKSDTLKALSPTDALRYLADEKTKINDVQVKVKSSLDQSRTFLGQ